MAFRTRHAFFALFRWDSRLRRRRRRRRRDRTPPPPKSIVGAVLETPENKFCRQKRFAAAHKHAKSSSEMNASAGWPPVGSKLSDGSTRSGYCDQGSGGGIIQAGCCSFDRRGGKRPWSAADNGTTEPLGQFGPLHSGTSHGGQNDHVGEYCDCVAEWGFGENR